mmetsp:Transcript_60424/g.72641  ORF Transcript_60424/g.72641 Transcript_60424/m.72641 type:complete len:230 (+) Transcript_60424:1235-1924(+)
MSSVSAASTCSASNSGTFRCAAQSSPSSTQPSLTPAVSHVIQSVPKVLESITVTTRLISANAVAGWPIAVASIQFFFTTMGSAMPLSSTTTASNSLLPPSNNVSMLSNNSSASEQQAHPFCNSMVSPSFSNAAPVGSFSLWDEREESESVFIRLARMSLASIFTEATSFTITPTLYPSLLERRLVRQDVLPLPRNPARSVTGTGVLDVIDCSLLVVEKNLFDRKEEVLE